jgi:intein/homing endonuclease
MKIAGYKIKNFQYVEIPPISPDLCYFVGLVMTDGHIHITRNKNGSTSYKVMLFTSYENEKDMIVSLINKLFNYKSLVRIKKYGWNVSTNNEIHISSKILTKFLNEKFEIPIGNKSNSIRVPTFFFNTSKDNITSFLRGVIDGDGSVCENAFKLTISSGSFLFLKGIKKLFFELGLNPSNIRKYSNENVFEVGFYKKSEIEKLYNFLYPASFYYLRKKLTLDKLLIN